MYNDWLEVTVEEISQKTEMENQLRDGKYRGEVEVWKGGE